jgi:putative peptidoglycan lipid II flippase
VEDEQPSLSRTTAVMAVGTMLSRVTGFGRVFALAYALGFTRLTDSYNLANTAPNILYELVLGGVLSATLIPVFVDHLTNRDEDEAWRSVSAVVTAAGAVLIAISAVFALAAPWIIRLYTLNNDTASAADERYVATYLLRLFAPQVFLLGAITLTTALLNARRRFAVPMFTPIANNLLTIGVLLAFPHVARSVRIAAVRHDHRALLLLGLGTTAGYLLQAVLQVPALRAAGVRFRAVWAPGDEAVRTVLRLSGWTAGVVVGNQLALWISLVLANGRAGDVSAFNAAFMFFQLPHAVFAVSVMTALLPDLSETWSRRDIARFRERLRTGMRVTLALLVPAAAAYVLLARPIVSVVLEHGQLSSASARTTGDVLALFALGLPAFSAYLLLMRAYQAMRDTRRMFYVYVVENGANVVLAFALYPSMGVQGIALSLSLAYVLGAAVAFADLRRRVGFSL